jgi:hypothetical protein
MAAKIDSAHHIASHVTVERQVSATPERIFAVLTDAVMLPAWVIGVTHLQRADPDWPQVGTRIERALGAWPLTISAITVSEGYEPLQLLRLRRRVPRWPDFLAEVAVLPTADGSRVRIVAASARRAVPGVDTVLADLRRRRVDRSLARLADIAESRSRIEFGSH